jgi:quinol-cytochrome oxidoreductase complex cytochrome b subunit
MAYLERPHSGMKYEIDRPMKTRANFFKHLHPPMIRSRTLDPRTTLGLGIVCLTCLLLLVATGLTLLLYYVPHQDHAYERILHIMTTLRYGRIIVSFR